VEVVPVLRKTIGVAVALAATSLATGVAYASNGHGNDHSQLAIARRATAKYHDLNVANNDGYGLFTDAAGIACIDMPGMGAMGVHYVKGALVGDGAVDPATPEAVVYAPDEHGRPHLAALEYVVFKADWDANHDSPPTMFGQTFNFTDAGNRYGLPPFYSLHAWIWKHNPAGTFAMWNPNVSCQPGDDHSGHDHSGHGDDHGGDGQDD
jgi:hypothetical protein